jgi:hypothetical protein
MGRSWTLWLTCCQPCLTVPCLPALAASATRQPADSAPLQPHQFDWQALGAEVARLVPWAPVCDTMVGPLERVWEGGRRRGHRARRQAQQVQQVGHVPGAASHCHYRRHSRHAHPADDYVDGGLCMQASRPRWRPAGAWQAIVTATIHCKGVHLVHCMQCPPPPLVYLVPRAKTCMPSSDARRPPHHHPICPTRPARW